MSLFQNLTSTCVVVQQLDDGMRSDAHNGMIVASTVLAVVGVQFLHNCYALYTRYRARASSTKDLTPIVPPTTNVTSHV